MGHLGAWCLVEGNHLATVVAANAFFFPLETKFLCVKLTRYQASLKLRDPPVSGFPALELQTCMCHFRLAVNVDEF